MLHESFSQPGATAISWDQGRKQLEQAEIYWISTVRPDGRPHVTPLIAIWMNDTLYFSTGPAERKALNLASNPHCVITTGCNALNEGLDVVLEGEAVRVSDEDTLQRLADAYVAKYDKGWQFTVRDGALFGRGGEAWVFAVAPTTVFGFGRGTFSQTRWRFA